MGRSITNPRSLRAKWTVSAFEMETNYMKTRLEKLHLVVMSVSQELAPAVP